ncbi:hypothetical protein FHS55_001340 [Angulomicrobium tetraedrale]|uniref:DUF4412 domain-containing protein n=1 Tax=Ancylobacter tetraedralis TaxID=217068 RepID=A0A839Z8T5_9HYPH|nr:hypothetical protein [Ancylobacter tetraedralis]MBB3770745.1 hypothetical protein [Ancylobacter tetraedralis]
MMGRSGLAIVALIVGMPVCGAFAGEPVPRAAVDYNLTARTAERARLSLAHSNGWMRVELEQLGVPGTFTGLIDFTRNRMLVMASLPGLDRMAIDMAMPADFAVVDMGGQGTRTGVDMVAGQPCDVWRAQEKRSGALIDTCVTEDGITLRAVADVNGKKTLIFEAETLERRTQDPAIFKLPKGVKVTRVPGGLMDSLVPSLLP